MLNVNEKQELLIYAAKAAGLLNSVGWGFDSYAPYYTGRPKEPEPTYWNPLDDDGDSRWLMNKLNLELDVCSTGVAVRTPTGIKILATLKTHKDIHTATRFALVKAAEEMGRNMREPL